jgi:hypothetical protein
VAGTLEKGSTPQAAASEALRGSGIPGIRYLDQGSRAIIEPPRQIEMNDGSVGWEVDSPTGTRKFTDKPAADAFYKTVRSDKNPTSNYVLFDDALAQNPRKSGQPRPTQGPPTTPARNLTRDAKGRFTSGKPDDMRLKILTDMANAARSREDQQTNERLSALANR